MSQSYPSNWKQCASCGYWAGEREASRFGDRVMVESANAKGKCMNRDSGWWRLDKQVTMCCSCYEKWCQLK